MGIRLACPIEWHIIVAPAALMVVIGSSLVGRAPPRQKEVAPVGTERSRASEILLETGVRHQVLSLDVLV
jgi:hypothetical protein